MARPIPKLLVGFFILAVLLVAVEVVLTLSQPRPAPPPLPNPNGYDDFLQASSLISGAVGDYLNSSQEELHVLAHKNEEALKLVKRGLSRECRVPLDYSPTNSAHIEHLSGFKRLSQAVTATGRLADLENRPADAARAYLTAIQLGTAVSQGGLLIDSLVGIAIESLGATPLQRLVPALDARQCREVIAVIEAGESRREPVEAVLARERVWMDQTYGLKGRIIRLVAFHSTRQSEQRATAKVQSHQARMRALMIQLAARAYELEKGEPAKGFADLVPVYLKAIPQDPLTGTNMAYRP